MPPPPGYGVRLDPATGLPLTNVPQPPGYGVRLDPATGLPLTSVPQPSGYGAAVDPATGLPLAQGSGLPWANSRTPSHPWRYVIEPATGLPKSEPDWKESGWADPAIVLASVEYDGLPVSQVARDLRKQFKDDFDILLPQPGGVGQHDGNAEPIDWLDTIVNLQLKNVKASEVFNAMNLFFENNRTPLRWELKVNGARQLALLRVLQDPPPADLFGKPVIKRVFFVGDLIDDKVAGMEGMGNIVATVQEVCRLSSNNKVASIQFHEKAQLLIVTGTDEELNIMQQTIEALRAKVVLEREKRHEKEAKARFEGLKSGGDGIK